MVLRILISSALMLNIRRDLMLLGFSRIRFTRDTPQGGLQ